MVEFVLVMAVLLPLFTGILQLGLVLHVRNTLTACAHEGARLGANFSESPGTQMARGRALAVDCVTGSLSSGMAGGVRQPYLDTAGGQPIVVQEVRAHMPTMGIWGPKVDFTVAGHAVQEPDPTP